MKFRVEKFNNILRAIFEDEEPPRSWLLSFLLMDAQSFIPDFLNEIEKAKREEKIPTGFTGNNVNV